MYNGSPRGGVILIALLFSNDVHGVNNTRNVAEQGQNDVDPEMFAKTFLKKHAQWRQQDGDQYSNKIHWFS